MGHMVYVRSKGSHKQYIKKSIWLLTVKLYLHKQEAKWGIACQLLIQRSIPFFIPSIQNSKLSKIFSKFNFQVNVTQYLLFSFGSPLSIYLLIYLLLCMPLSPNQLTFLSFQHKVPYTLSSIYLVSQYIQFVSILSQ